VVACDARATSTSKTCAPRRTTRTGSRRRDDHLPLHPRVFEEHIREICDIVHGHGGQVYLDGANLNAQVGLSRPGDYGADVSHLNLHKTFCIPMAAAARAWDRSGCGRTCAVPARTSRHRWRRKARVGPVSAAPFGSASILTISYIYILMMGGEGLTRATKSRSSTPTTSLRGWTRIFRCCTAMQGASP